jgi:hypothetical protein
MEQGTGREKKNVYTTSFSSSGSSLLPEAAAKGSTMFMWMLLMPMLMQDESGCESVSLSYSLLASQRLTGSSVCVSECECCLLREPPFKQPKSRFCCCCYGSAGDARHQQQEENVPKQKVAELPVWRRTEHIYPET